MKSSRRDLTSGSVPEHLFRLSWPMAWGILAVLAVQLTDAYFISHLGPLAMAAIGFTFPVTMVVQNIVFGLSIAVTALLARHYGQKDMSGVRITLTTGLWLGIALGVLLAVLGELALVPLFTMLGAPASVMPYIHDYMSLWFFGAVLFVLPVVGNAGMRAMGDTLWPSLVMTSVAVINIPLNPIFMHGYFGLPAMGIKGSALATLVSYAVAAILCLCILMVRERLFTVRQFLFSKSIAKEVTGMAIPIALSNLVPSLSAGALTHLVAAFGVATVAAYGVAVRLEAFSLLLVMAVAAAMAPLLAQNWGAGALARVSQALRYGLGFALISSVCVAGAIWVFGHNIAGIFTTDASIISPLVMYLAVVPLSYFGTAFMAIASSALNATGQPKKGLVLQLVKAFVCVLPLAALGGYLYGYSGLIYGVAAGNLIAGVMGYIWIKSLLRAPVAQQDRALVS